MPLLLLNVTPLTLSVSWGVTGGQQRWTSASRRLRRPSPLAMSLLWWKFLVSFRPIPCRLSWGSMAWGRSASRPTNANYGGSNTVFCHRQVCMTLQTERVFALWVHKQMHRKSFSSSFLLISVPTHFWLLANSHVFRVAHTFYCLLLFYVIIVENFGVINTVAILFDFLAWLCWGHTAWRNHTHGVLAAEWDLWSAVAQLWLRPGV